jgi:hypothetical protein
VNRTSSALLHCPVPVARYFDAHALEQTRGELIVLELDRNGAVGYSGVLGPQVHDVIVRRNQ